MIIVLPSHFELTFFLLTPPKCYLRKVKKKRCFKGFEIWPLTFPVWLWTLTFDFETLTQILPLHQLKLRLTRRRWSDDYSSRIETLNLFSASWLNLIAKWKRCLKCSQSTLNSYLPLVQPIMRVQWSQENDVSSCPRHCQLIYCLLTSPKCDLRKVKKRWFKGFEIYCSTFHFWPWTLNFELRLWNFISNSNSSPAQNASNQKTEKQCNKWSQRTLNSFCASWPAQIRLE